MELMVGLTIGLLVVIGAIGSLVFSQTTTTVLADTSRLQQNADAIFSNIGHHLMQAGAVNIEWNEETNAGVRFSESYTGLSTATTGLAGQMLSIHGIDGTSNSPDTLRVSYQDNMLGPSSTTINTTADTQRFGIRDCLGNRPAVPFFNIDNEFSITGTNLMCRGSSAAPNNALAIADGIEDFQVWYGIQTRDVADTLQYLFYTANSVPSWTNIHAVRVCLVLRGDSQGNPTTGTAFKNCNGQDMKDSNGKSITEDGRLRRVYQRTFALRNALL